MNARFDRCGIFWVIIVVSLSGCVGLVRDRPRPDTRILRANWELARRNIEVTPESYEAAVKRGDVETKDLLIDAGIFPDDPHRIAVPFLESLGLATYWGNTNIMLLELERGKDPNSLNGCRAKTPLMLAVSQGDPVERRQLCNILLQYGANIDLITTNSGACNFSRPESEVFYNSALAEACQNWDDSRMAWMLIDLGARCDGIYGLAALNYATWYMRDDVIKHLVEHGATLDDPCLDRSPLESVIGYSQYLANYLIDKGGIRSDRTATRSLFMCISAQPPSRPTVRLVERLIEKGASPLGSVHVDYDPFPKWQEFFRKLSPDLRGIMIEALKKKGYEALLEDGNLTSLSKVK